MLKEILGGPRWAPEPQDVLQGRPGHPESAKMAPKEASGQPFCAKIAQRDAQDEPTVTKESSKM